MRLGGAGGAADALAQTVVAELEDAVFEEDVAGLEVAVDDAVLVEVANGASQRQKPLPGQVGRQPLRMAVEDDVQRLAGHILHHHPVLAAVVGLEVEETDQMRMLEVQALGHAAHLDVLRTADELERHLLAAVAQRVVDFAEAAGADAALDRVTVERTLSRTVGELHGDPWVRTPTGGRNSPGRTGPGFWSGTSIHPTTSPALAGFVNAPTGRRVRVRS